MSALTAERSTKRMGDAPIASLLCIAVAASTKIYKGGLVALDSSGNAIPASASAALPVGLCEETVDNSSGSAGALSVRIRQGVFKFDNSSSTDAIAAGDVGHFAYMVDDHTVAKTAAVGRKAAGLIVQVDTDGVWVEVRLREPKAPFVVAFPIDLASVGNNADVVTDYVFGFAGRIEKLEFVVNKPVTTSAKAATLNAEIGSTNLTGGAVALTSANCTPQGAKVAMSAIIAGNYFGPTDTFSIEAASVTAFVEGSGSLLVTVRPA